MKLKIGEMSTLFQVSTDTLRYYDKEGILCPKKDEQSGYRYYEPIHIEQLYYIVFLRSLGASIQEINYLLHNRTLKNMKKLLEERKKHLQEEIERLQQLEKKVNNHLHVINKVENNLEHQIINMPPFTGSFYEETAMLDKDKILEVGEMFKKFWDNNEGGFIITKKDGWQVTDWGLVRKGQRDGDALLFKEKRCVNGYFSGTIEEFGDYLNHLEEIYQQQGVQFSNQIILIESFFMVEEGKDKTVGEFYIPIKENT
ncbi:MAG: MerR family transcriptional regulator [Bacillaceae bacterium]